MSTRGYCCPSFGNDAPPTPSPPYIREVPYCRCELWLVGSALFEWKQRGLLLHISPQCFAFHLHRVSCQEFNRGLCLGGNVERKKKNEIQTMRPVHVFSCQRKEHLSRFETFTPATPETSAWHSWKSFHSVVDNHIVAYGNMKKIWQVWHLYVHAHSTCTHTGLKSIIEEERLTVRATGESSWSAEGAQLAPSGQVQCGWGHSLSNSHNASRIQYI